MMSPMFLMGLLLALGTRADAGATGLVVDRREEPYEIFVTVHESGSVCPAVEWRRKSRQLRLQVCPGKTVADAVAPLRGMLVRMSEAEGPAVAEATLFVSLDYLSYPQYVGRLARHASEAKDRKPGQGINQYIAAVTTPAMIAELGEVVAGIGRKTTLSSVEKCSEARPVGKREMSAWLRAQGLRGNEMLPMGCLMGWVRLQ